VHVPEARRTAAQQVLNHARRLRAQFGSSVHDHIAGSMYARAAQIAQSCVRVTGQPQFDWDLWLDRVLTGKWLGIPIMILGLGVTLWVTIVGANMPSEALFQGLFWIHDLLDATLTNWGLPAWLVGFLVHGVYRGLAWVVAVMLPPMAIFFPIFTLLEDIGYLPRVAFNLDRLFRWCGAHGKQSLTMSMALGCNAAGVIACRIIDSPRERLIAILTNNFVLCNGRWPTIIMLASVFVAAAFPAGWSSLVATCTIVAVALVGVLVTFIVSKLLSGTVLKGKPSHFFLELPPFRRPNILRVIYRSLIDRTMFVLGRACMVAAPAGGLIWLLGNLEVNAQSLMSHLSGWLDPLGIAIGLDGVILLAFVVAIPANEIVVPTIIMAYLGSSQITELDDMSALAELFTVHHWTLTTAACMMLFSLLHYPCTTTSLTIYRETRSWKWTLLANVVPLTIAVLVCAAVAQTARWLN
jgi:ferrous iron transport protein B